MFGFRDGTRIRVPEQVRDTRIARPATRKEALVNSPKQSAAASILNSNARLDLATMASQRKNVDMQGKEAQNEGERTAARTTEERSLSLGINVVESAKRRRP